MDLGTRSVANEIIRVVAVAVGRAQVNQSSAFLLVDGKSGDARGDGGVGFESPVPEVVRIGKGPERPGHPLLGQGVGGQEAGVATGNECRGEGPLEKRDVLCAGDPLQAERLLDVADLQGSQEGQALQSQGDLVEARLATPEVVLHPEGDPVVNPSPGKDLGPSDLGGVFLLPDLPSRLPILGDQGEVGLDAAAELETEPRVPGLETESVLPEDAEVVGVDLRPHEVLEPADPLLEILGLRSCPCTGNDHRDRNEERRPMLGHFSLGFRQPRVASVRGRINGSSSRDRARRAHLGLPSDPGDEGLPLPPSRVHRHTIESRSGRT